MVSIKDNVYSPGLIFNVINPNNTPLLAKVLKENYSSYEFTHKEDILEKFLNNSCAEIDYGTLINCIIEKSVSQDRDYLGPVLTGTIKTDNC